MQAAAQIEIEHSAICCAQQSCGCRSLSPSRICWDGYGIGDGTCRPVDGDRLRPFYRGTWTLVKMVASSFSYTYHLHFYFLAARTQNPKPSYPIYVQFPLIDSCQAYLSSPLILICTNHHSYLLRLLLTPPRTPTPSSLYLWL